MVHLHGAQFNVSGWLTVSLGVYSVGNKSKMQPLEGVKTFAFPIVASV